MCALVYHGQLQVSVVSHTTSFFHHFLSCHTDQRLDMHVNISFLLNDCTQTDQFHAKHQDCRLYSMKYLISPQPFASPVRIVLLICPQVTIFLQYFWLMVLVSLTQCAAYLVYHYQQPRRSVCNPRYCGTNVFTQCLQGTTCGTNLLHYTFGNA